MKRQNVQETIKVIQDMRACAVTHGRKVCLIGNITAGEIVDTCEEVMLLIAVHVDAVELSKKMPPPVEAIPKKP